MRSCSERRILSLSSSPRLIRSCVGEIACDAPVSFEGVGGTAVIDLRLMTIGSLWIGIDGLLVGTVFTGVCLGMADFDGVTAAAFAGDAETDAVFPNTGSFAFFTVVSGCGMRDLNTGGEACGL